LIFQTLPRFFDWSGAEVGKFYRPTKKPITMRLDSDVIAWLKADGRGYQTKANWLPRHAMLHYTRERVLASVRASVGRPRNRKERRDDDCARLEASFVTEGHERVGLHRAAGGQAARPTSRMRAITAASVDGSVVETPEIWLAKKRVSA
jgi:hypothetical protein